MHIHPPLSGLPLAGIGLLVLLELGRFFRRTHEVAEASRALIVIATVLGVVCSFFSGYHASSALGDVAAAVGDVIARHHAAGRFLLINALLLATFFFLARIAVHGRKVLVALYYVTLFVQLIGTVWVGRLGGELVFDYGVGVSSSVLPKQ